MERRTEAEKIIKKHVVWSMGAGLMPVPLFDIAAVTAIQMDLLNQLAALYGADYSKSKGKQFVSALTGSTFARIGASLVKSIPGVGSVIGGLSMSMMSGASTYAVGHVAMNHIEGKGDFLDVDMDWAKDAYKKALEKGKEFAAKVDEKMAGEPDDPENVITAMEKLKSLRDKDLITNEEFETRKKDLLDKLVD